MQHITDKEKNKLLETSNNILTDCATSLTRITTTCCMPERSEKMQAAFDTLNNAHSFLKNQENKDNSTQIQNDSHYTECQEYLSQFGGHIGALYVSCCTDTREPLYQHILKQLNRVSTNLNTMLGHSH